MVGTSLHRSSAPPLYATPRNPARWSEGAQVGIIADRLGTPLTPMQQQIADVAGERREDGQYEYQVVVVSVPRQTGKTTLLRAVGTHRSLVLGRDVFYTAQTGKDARERWTDLVSILRKTDLFAGRYELTLRGGSEAIRFNGGGAFRVFAPTPESLHGYTPPTVMIDEAFAQYGDAGDLLMGAIGPAQFTLLDKQIWIVSTAGTAESTFLHDWIDRAMEGTARVAGFVWGARDDQDPFNLDDIAAFHPGVGHRFNGKLLTAADVLAEADRNSRAEYERAFANRRTVTLSHLVPGEVWRALAVEQLEVPESGVVFAYDVAADRRSGCIVAAWTVDGVAQVKVVRADIGTSWMARDIRELRRRFPVVAAGNGPVLEITEQLDRVQVLSEREYATACGAFLTSIEDARLVHDGSDVLAASVAGLVTRAAVSDGIAFSRRHSVGDSSPAVAAALATWYATARPRTGKPRSRHQQKDAAA